MRLPGLRCTLTALSIAASSLQAQSLESPHRTFWFTGGAGYGWTSMQDDILPSRTSAWAIAASMQNGGLVTSVRTTRFYRNNRSGWDAGALIGAGSPTRHPVWGSIG